MHITIATIGSRGDVQPFIALALGLQQAGHTVRLATHANFETEIKARGLEFAEIAGNPQESIQSELGQKALRSENSLNFARYFAQMLQEIIEPALLDSRSACQETDAIITGNAVFWGYDIVEALRVPCYFTNHCSHI